VIRHGLLAGVVALALLAACATTSGAPPSVAAPPALQAGAAHVEPVGDPEYIKIPRLHIEDDIIPVGLAADGTMEVPAVEHSGWYDLGPRPGAPGGAVVVGHVNYSGVQGALGRIGELTNGDQVSVTDTAGVVRTFTVYDVEHIPKSQYAARTVPLVFGARTTTDLVIVTCGGQIVGHSYLDNVVVSARLVQM